MKVVVTRPAHQAKDLIDGLALIGCEAVSVPTVDIVVNSFEPTETPNIFIVTSVNAAICFSKLNVASNAVVIAVGPSTKRALLERNIEAICPEHNFTSEGVLQMSLLAQVQDQTIAIVKGDGGRDKIATTLSERGARVENWNLYRRVSPKSIDLTAFVRADAIWISSYDSFTNLYHLGREIWHDLTKLIWMVPSQRVADLIGDRVETLHVANSALNQDVIALCQEIIDDKRKPRQKEPNR